MGISVEVCFSKTEKIELSPDPFLKLPKNSTLYPKDTCTFVFNSALLAIARNGISLDVQQTIMNENMLYIHNEITLNHEE